MSSSPGSRTDLHGGTVWIAFGLALIVGSWRMDRFESMGASLYTAPGLVPGLYGVLLVLLGGLLAWRGVGVRRTRDTVDGTAGVQAAANPEAAAAADASAPAPLLNRRVLQVLALTLGYAAIGLGRLPFAPLTAVFVAAFCWVFDERPAGWPRLRTAVLVGVGCAVVVVLVFERIFLVRLP